VPVVRCPTGGIDAHNRRAELGQCHTREGRGHEGRDLEHSESAQRKVVQQ